MSLITIIVPSYNHSRFLKERMDSLINQTYQNFEIIVIDDCSTENNLEILRAYKDNKKINIVTQNKNKGLVESTNLGIEMAKGEFVLIAQCDDSCSPKLLEMLYTGLKTNHSAGLSFARSNLINNQGMIIGSDFENRERIFRKDCQKNILISGVHMRRYLMHSCVIPNLSAVLFRRSVFEVIGKFSSEFDACIDWEFFFKMCSSYNFYYVAAPLNNFRQHESTIRAKMSMLKTSCEYVAVLLGQINSQHFKFFERNKYRFRAIYIVIVNTPIFGLFDPKYVITIVNRIYKFDKKSLWYFPIVLFYRFVVIFCRWLSSKSMRIRR